MRDAEEAMSDLNAKPIRTNYIRSFDLMRNSLQCFHDITVCFPCKIATVVQQCFRFQ